MRWDTDKSANVERPDVDKFIEEIAAVCHKHSLSISHEDRHGAFVVEPISEENIEWLKEAHVRSK